MADDPLLTRDNSLLSRPKIESRDDRRGADKGGLAHPTQMLNCAGACTERAEIEAYVAGGVAPATKRAYRIDLDRILCH